MMIWQGNNGKEVRDGGLYRVIDVIGEAIRAKKSSAGESRAYFV
jgi:hypothetical protein